MQTRRLGRSGLRVSEISLGSWLTFGNSVDVPRTVELVHRAFSLGINFFDTADVYAGGAAEEALGQALRALPRSQLVIATKCFFPMSDDPNDRGLSRKHVFESVDASLRRLGTDYVDLHQCHRADPDTPLEETVGAYHDLIRHGKVLYWGVSEWSADAIEACCRVADARHGHRPISNQPQYSIMRRRLEAEVRPACEREGLGQIVYSPLAQGVLTGKYSGGRLPESSRATDSRCNQFMTAYLEPDELERVDRLEPLADQLGVSMAQLALAWCLHQPGVASTLVGATSARQLEDNCGASGLRLPGEVLTAIDAIFPGPLSAPD